MTRSHRIGAPSLSVLGPIGGLFTLAVLAAGPVGCGGSSSETPWPVEPDDVDLGPNADKPPDERSGAVAPPPVEPEAETPGAESP